jgi:Uncharacterized enzyme involved in pigment biosynthesis
MNVRVNPEVEKALKEHKPVIALESTIISHGMELFCCLQHLV